MPEIRINGYVTYYEDDDFTDPWKARQTILIQHGFGRNSQFWRHWVPMLAICGVTAARVIRGPTTRGRSTASFRIFAAFAMYWNSKTSTCLANRPAGCWPLGSRQAVRRDSDRSLCAPRRKRLVPPRRSFSPSAASRGRAL